MRASIAQLVGGAGEDTILAPWVKDCISIGSAKSHKEVLESPDKISSVLSRGLDAGTAFEILSIDMLMLMLRKHRRELQIDQHRLIESCRSAGRRKTGQWLVAPIRNESESSGGKGESY